MAIEVKEFYTPESEYYGAPEGYCFRCTTTGSVFGPTLDADEGPERAEEFLQWILRWHGDPRSWPMRLPDLYRQWQKETPL